MPLLFKRRAAAARKLRQLGYRYITLDLEGYRCGSLNEAGK
jgi:PP-loop superfamily ATP-utilizing enzyme